ncbi:MAG: ATP-binding protein [Saccharothrix sp.]|nr:ATP-binding protein [Saccharothrix sp.]
MIPSTADTIGRQVAALVRDLAARADLDRTRAYRLRLAVDEIATNAVTHGGVDVVHLCGGVAEDRVWVVLEDSAPPFDPRAHDPSAVLATSPEDRAPGGLGLFLVHSGVDELHYDRADDRNRTTLVVHRESSVPRGTMEPGAGGHGGTGG